MEQKETFNISDETKPEHYLSHYRDVDSFTAINIYTHEQKSYSGKEYQELFMNWYAKIKPFLDTNDEPGVLNVLIDWDEETLAKSDMYTLVRKYLKK